jgi:hypothetical protein
VHQLGERRLDHSDTPRANIPEVHPRTVYLPEPVLHQAITGWLATAILGPERADYWNAALGATDDKEEREETCQRLAEIDRDVQDLTRRLHRQIVNLEDENLSTVARSQTCVRIGELEADLATLQAMAEQLRSQAESDTASPDEIATAVARLPQLAEALTGMPQPALRELYESLDLQVRLIRTTGPTTSRSRSPMAQRWRRRRSVPCPRREP